MAHPITALTRQQSSAAYNKLKLENGVLINALSAKTERLSKKVDEAHSKIAQYREQAMAANAEAQNYGAALLRLRAKLRDALPEEHEAIWASVKHNLIPTLTARFELSSASKTQPIRQSFHNMLLAIKDIPIDARKAIGSFLSKMLANIEDEGPSVAYMKKMCHPHAYDNCANMDPAKLTDRQRLLRALSKQHNELIETCAQIDKISLKWTVLPSEPLRTALSAQSRNMNLQFWLTLGNRVQMALFNAKNYLSSGFHINYFVQQALLSEGLKSRRELEALLATFVNEGESHFRNHAQFGELLSEFRKTCTFLDTATSTKTSTADDK